MSERPLLELFEEAMAQDRAVYQAAGLLDTVRCEWCGDMMDPYDEHQSKRIRRNRSGFTFCSEYCRRAWRRVEGQP